jgi:hypothetical protein
MEEEKTHGELKLDSRKLCGISELGGAAVVVPLASGIT